MKEPGGVIFLCLASGAGLGGVFLGAEALAGLLGCRKLGRAVLDLACCAVAGAVVFLCALAVDSGRVRLVQAALQALGGWAVWTAFAPWARRTRKLGAAWRGRLRARVGEKSPKRAEKAQKAEKKT